MLPQVLTEYGIDLAECRLDPVGYGLINQTWKVTGPGFCYILQQVNTGIFRKPEVIASNLESLSAYLKRNSPGYFFPVPVPAKNKQLLVGTRAAAIA